jgi:ABC-type Zn2+ transport system substrate-binding protein/surface adhesin
VAATTSGHEHDHAHEHDHDHDHAHEREHAHARGLSGFFESLFKPHSHDAAKAFARSSCHFWASA